MTVPFFALSYLLVFAPALTPAAPNATRASASASPTTLGTVTVAAVGFGVGLAVAFGVGLGVGLGEGVGVGLGEGVGVGTGVGAIVGVGVGITGVGLGGGRFGSSTSDTVVDPSSAMSESPVASIVHEAARPRAST